VMSGQDGWEPPEKRARSEEPSSDDRYMLEPPEKRARSEEPFPDWFDGTVMPLSPPSSQPSQLMDQPAVVALSADADEPAAGVQTVVIDPNNLPPFDPEAKLRGLQNELLSIFKNDEPPTLEDMLGKLQLVRGFWTNRDIQLGIHKPLCPLLKALSGDEFLWWFFDTIMPTKAWEKDKYVFEHFNRVVNNTFKAFLLVYTFFTAKGTLVKTQELHNFTKYTIEVNTYEFELIGPKRKGKTGPKSKGKTGPKSKGKTDWRKVWFGNMPVDTERFKRKLNELGLFKGMDHVKWVSSGKIKELPRWDVTSSRDKRISIKGRTTTLIFTLPGKSLVVNKAPRFAPGDADAGQ